jgi:hypothetical protein
MASLCPITIINDIGSNMSARAGDDNLAVNDVNITSQLVILGVVASIIKGNPEVKRRLFMHGINCLNGGIENMGRCEYNR